MTGAGVARVGGMGQAKASPEGLLAVAIGSATVMFFVACLGFVVPLIAGKNASEKDREAFKLFREADLMEADGHAAEAARKYRHACRLSPSLASVYGL